MSNRFTRLAPTTFDDIELFQPNYQALDVLLGTKQKEYDTTIAAVDALIPDALSAFQDDADVYYNKWRQRVEALPETFSKDYRQGNKELRTILRDIRRELKDPNSEFKHFANTKQQYLQGIQRIEEFHKKDPIKYNKEWAMNQLNTQLENAKWEDFYKDGRVIKGFSDPQLTPYIDIQKDVVDIIGKIKSNQVTEFEGLNKWWIKKIQTEGVTPEAVEKVTQQLLNNPKYKDQLMIENWYKTRGYDKDAGFKEYKTKLETNQKNIFKSFDDVAKSKNKESIKELQNILNIGGYYDDVSKNNVDGDFGKKSQAALDKYKKDYQLKLTNKLADEEGLRGEFDKQLYKEVVLDPYINTAKGLFAFEKVDKDLIYNRQKDLNLRLAQSRSNTAKMIQAMETLVAEPDSEIITTPYVGWSMKTFDEQSKDIDNNVAAAKANMNQVLNADNMKELFGQDKTVSWGDNTATVKSVNPDFVREAITTIDNIEEQNPTLSRDEKIVMYANQMGITDLDRAEKQYNETVNGGINVTYRNSAKQLYDAENQKAMLEDTKLSLQKTYLDKGGEDKINTVKNSYPGFTDKFDNNQILSMLNDFKDVVKTGIDGDRYYVTYKDGTYKYVSAEEGKFANLYHGSKASGVINDYNKGLEKSVQENPQDYANSTRSFIITQDKGQYQKTNDNLNTRLNDQGLQGLVTLTGQEFPKLYDDKGNLADLSKTKNYKATPLLNTSEPTILVTGIVDGKKVSNTFQIPYTLRADYAKGGLDIVAQSTNANERVNAEAGANLWASMNGAYSGLAMFKAGANIEQNKTDRLIHVDMSRPNEAVKFETHGLPLEYKPGGNNTYYLYRANLPNDAKGYIATIKTMNSEGKVIERLIPVEGMSGFKVESVEDLTTQINLQEALQLLNTQIDTKTIPSGQYVNPETAQKLIRSGAIYNALNQQDNILNAD